MAQNVPYPSVKPPYQVYGEANGVTAVDVLVLAIGTGTWSPGSTTGFTVSGYLVANVTATWVSPGNFPAYSEYWSKNPSSLVSQTLRAYAVAFALATATKVGATTLAADTWYQRTTTGYGAATVNPTFSSSWYGGQWSAMKAATGTPTASKYWALSWSDASSTKVGYAVPQSSGAVSWSKAASSNADTLAFPLDGSRYLLLTTKSGGTAGA